MCRREGQEITVQPADEDFPVGYLGFMAFAGFELYLAFQIHISCEQDVLGNVVVERFHRDAQLRMIRNDHIRRLTLEDQRPDNII